jgi:phosphatidyl-myo-inositol dimannoside synthase
VSDAPARAPMSPKISAHPQRRIVALFPALNGLGGIQQANRLTAAALAEIAPCYRWSADFLSLNDSPQDHALAFNGASIPFSGFGRAKARLVLSALARSRAGTRVVLAAHPYLAVAAAQMKLIHPRLKTIVISHGVEVWQPLPALRRRALSAADIYVAPSSYTIERLVETQGAPRAKTRRLPWPLSPDFLDLAARPDLLTVPPGFPMGLVVLATARLDAGEKYKGVDQLIRAIGQLAPKIPSLQLAVVASGDDLARHEQLAGDLGVSERVRFFPELSRAEIAACYSRCDVFALPSTGEGFGFVFLEAMAFGKPVVGAAAGGVKDIIEHEKNGLLVVPGDLDALVDALARLLANERLRAELGRAGSDSVRARFQFETFRSRLEAILRECGLASEENR